MMGLGCHLLVRPVVCFLSLSLLPAVKGDVVECVAAGQGCCGSRDCHCSRRWQDRLQSELHTVPTVLQGSLKKSLDGIKG